jgi:phosphoenolpyruvate-protein phosphotransferase (PTS system enzyme I)
MKEVKIQGIGASSGIAIGPAYVYLPPDLAIPKRKPSSLEEELSLFENSCTTAQLELEQLKKIVSERAGRDEEAAIFDAHLMMIEDPALYEQVEKSICEGFCVEIAVDQATKTLANILSSMQDEMFAARAIDVLDVGKRLIRILLEKPESSLQHLQHPSIILAHDLTPSDTACLDPEKTLGFCTESGGLTSHSAILARTLGIPAVVGLGNALKDIGENGLELVMDGTEGVLIAHPQVETRERYETTRAEFTANLLSSKESAKKETYTLNGRRVEVAANIGEVESAVEALEYGAEGIGLLRTEFLYLQEKTPPSEDKQYSVYKKIFQDMGGRTVIVRTLDIGGDKPPAFLEFSDEMNPFLGWRAIRICLEETQLFKTQLRAIIRAAVGYEVWLMIPMIISLEELKQAQKIMMEVQKELEEEGLGYKKDVPLGIMVETPAAAMIIDSLCDAASFFSIGTNDLTQYTLAVDRGNPKVANLFQPLHPAVLRLIKHIIDTAHAKGKWVGMCGELAGMPKAIPILLGLGLDEFSMAHRSIPEAKRIIARISDHDARQIAENVMKLQTSSEIEMYMSARIKELSKLAEK